MEHHTHESRTILQVLPAPHGMVSIYMAWDGTKELVVEPVYYVARIRKELWDCRRHAPHGSCGFYTREQWLNEIGKPETHIFVEPLMYMEGDFDLEDGNNHLGYAFTRNGELTEDQRAEWMAVLEVHEHHKKLRQKEATQ